MKAKALISFLFIAQLCWANMASPVRRGTESATVFSSRDIDIFSETIHITINPDFTTAKFIVEYTIYSDTSGTQIPLLFYARDYKDSFMVWVNNQRVNIRDIPDEYAAIEHSPFSAFSHSFNKDDEADGQNKVMIYWQEHNGSAYELNDLKYFETPLSEGKHVVRITYTANAWKDISGWVSTSSFRYSLSPAKFWKSFGTLHVTIEQEGTVRQLSTNIGVPEEKDIQAKNNWTFASLPAEYIEISSTPVVSTLASILIALSPLGLTIISGIILLALHLVLVKAYRRRNPERKYSPVVVWGSLLVPFLILLGYIFSFGLIDAAIGKDAGRYHGYTFLVMVLYPVLLLFYWLVVWLVDRREKRKLKMTVAPDELPS